MIEEGDTIYYWTAIRSIDGMGNFLFECNCNRGIQKTYHYKIIESGKVKSCGCHIEYIKNPILQKKFVLYFEVDLVLR